jgi:Wzt C-terminal domain
VRVLEAHLENEAGDRVDSVEHGAPIRLRLELEAVRDLPGLDVFFSVNDADGAPLTKFGVTVGDLESRELHAGQRVQVEADLGNPLAPGRYHFNCGINLAFTGDVALFVPNMVGFVVFGSSNDYGMVQIPVEYKATVDPAGKVGQ